MNPPVSDPTNRAAEPADLSAVQDTGAESPGKAAALSRRQLDEIFGDVLPTLTRDELEEREGSAGRAADTDRWYRDNLPPHHG